MLGKLIKHEWKNSWKVPTVLSIALLVISFFSGFTFMAPIWDYEAIEGIEILIVLIWLLFYFSIIAVSLGVTLYMAVRFYKTMFTDEGYLTHTLPVTSHQLLISKLLPMAAWMAISTIAIIVSVGIFCLMALLFLEPDGISLWEQFIANGGFQNLWRVVVEEIGISFLLVLLLMVIVGAFSGPMMVIGSISLGQMVSKHKILGSIGAYFAISTIMQIVSTFTMLPLSFGMINANPNPENVFDVLNSIYLIAILLSILSAVLLYFLSEFLIRKKLNLD